MATWSDRLAAARAATRDDAPALFLALAQEALGEAAAGQRVAFDPDASLALARTGPRLTLGPAAFAPSIEETRARLLGSWDATAVDALFREASGRVTARTLGALAALAASWRGLPPAGKIVLAATCSVQFRKTATRLVPAPGTRSVAFERFVLGVTLALGETDLLAGEPLARIVASTLAPTTRAEATPREASPDLRAALERLEQASESDAPTAAAELRAAYALASEAAPASARALSVRSLEVAARAALGRDGIPGLERTARRFALALDGTSALDEATLAAVARGLWLARTPDATRDDARGGTEPGTTLGDRLLERADQLTARTRKLVALAREPRSLLARMEARLLRGPRLVIERLFASILRLDDRLFRFDRRFRMLDALLGEDWDEEGWDALAARLGSSLLRDDPEVRSFGGAMPSLDLVTTGTGAADRTSISYTGLGGASSWQQPFASWQPQSAGGGFTSGLELAGLPQMLAGLGASRGGPSSLSGLAPTQLAALARAMGVSLPGLQSKLALRAGSSSAALARSLGSSGNLASLQRLASIGGRGMGSLDHIFAGYQGLARKGGPRSPGILGLSSSLAASSPELAMLLPSLGRASLSRRSTGPLTGGGHASGHPALDWDRLLGFQRSSSGRAPGLGASPGSLPGVALPGFELSGANAAAGLDLGTFRASGSHARPSRSRGFASPKLGAIHGLVADGFGRPRLESFGRGQSLLGTYGSGPFTAGARSAAGSRPFSPGAFPAPSPGFFSRAAFAFGDRGLLRGGASRSAGFDFTRLGGLLDGSPLSNASSGLFPGAGLRFVPQAAWPGSTPSRSGGGAVRPGSPLALSRGTEWGLDGFGRLRALEGQGRMPSGATGSRRVRGGARSDVPGPRSDFPAFHGLPGSPAPASFHGLPGSRPASFEGARGGRASPLGFFSPGLLLPSLLMPALGSGSGGSPASPSFAASPGASGRRGRTVAPRGLASGAFSLGSLAQLGLGSPAFAPEAWSASPQRFSGASFSGASFPGASPSGARFSGASFPGASPSGARFSGASFAGPSFSAASFAGASFSGASFPGTSFPDASFSAASFPGASFPGASFLPPRFLAPDFLSPAFRGPSLPTALGSLGTTFPLAQPQGVTPSTARLFPSRSPSLSPSRSPSSAGIQPWSEPSSWSNLLGLLPALAPAQLEPFLQAGRSAPHPAESFAAGALPRLSPGGTAFDSPSSGASSWAWANTTPAPSPGLGRRGLAALGLPGLAQLGAPGRRLGLLSALGEPGTRPSSIAGFREHLARPGASAFEARRHRIAGASARADAAAGSEPVDSNRLMGFDLAAALMGATPRLPGSSALSLGGMGLAPAAPGGAGSRAFGAAPRWLDLAAFDLAKPALGVADVTRLGSRSLAPGRASSPLDLASWSGAPRVVPGLGRSSAVGAPLRLEPGRARWQDIAQAQLDLRSPVLDLGGSGAAPASGTSARFTLGDLVSFERPRPGSAPGNLAPPRSQASAGVAGIGGRDGEVLTQLFRGRGLDAGARADGAVSPRTAIGLAADPRARSLAAEATGTALTRPRGAFPGALVAFPGSSPATSDARSGFVLDPADPRAARPAATGRVPGSSRIGGALPRRDTRLPALGDLERLPGTLAALPASSLERFADARLKAASSAGFGTDLSRNLGRLALPEESASSPGAVGPVGTHVALAASSSPAPRAELTGPRTASSREAFLGSVSHISPERLVLAPTPRAGGRRVAAAQGPASRAPGRSRPTSLPGERAPLRRAGRVRHDPAAFTPPDEPGEATASGARTPGPRRAAGSRPGVTAPAPAPREGELVRTRTAGPALSPLSPRSGLSPLAPPSALAPRRPRAFARPRSGSPASSGAERPGAAQGWGPLKHPLARRGAAGLAAATHGPGASAPTSGAAARPDAGIFAGTPAAAGASWLAAPSDRAGSLDFVRSRDGRGTPAAFSPHPDAVSRHEAFSPRHDTFRPTDRFAPREGFDLVANGVTHALQSTTGTPAPMRPAGEFSSRPSDPRGPAARSPERPARAGSRPGQTSDGRPELEMEHTQLAPMRKAAIEHVDQLPGTTGSTETKVEASHVAGPSEQDLNPLVYQLYARIKRELLIERERRGQG